MIDKFFYKLLIELRLLAKTYIINTIFLPIALHQFATGVLATVYLKNKNNNTYANL